MVHKIMAEKELHVEKEADSTFLQQVCNKSALRRRTLLPLPLLVLTADHLFVISQSVNQLFYLLIKVAQN